MIRTKSLKKRYGEVLIAFPDLIFPDQGIVLIKGASGCGKTTFLRLLSGLETPDEGEISGTLGKRLSMSFQEARLAESKTVLENLFLVRKKTPESEAEALALLERFGLSEAKNKRARDLSGGMKGRLSLVRSVFWGGDVYLWDEPTRELDKENRSEVLALARELAGSKLVLIVTHDEALEGDLTVTLPPPEKAL